MAYAIVMTRPAKKGLADVPVATYRRVVATIAELGESPRGFGVIKLKGSSGGYRVRCGNYRVIFTIDDGAKLVTVEEVIDRKDAYGE